MTSKGLNEAINVWFAAYKPYFKAAAAAAVAVEQTVNEQED